MSEQPSHHRSSDRTLREDDSTVEAPAKGVRPQNVNEYLASLRTSGVVDSDTFKQLFERLNADDFKQPVEAFSKQLVAAGELTEFQAWVLATGHAIELYYGDYIVLDRIGSGGVATVFLARHRESGVRVALKIISKDDDRVDREVRMGAKLKHANIVQLLDHITTPSAEVLVMEYIDGKDLADLVFKSGAMSIPKAVDSILQAARALAAVHSHGIVHRDIKPHNILVDSNGTVKLLDLGLARFEYSASYGDRLTAPDAMLGTPAYMAPEQIEDPRQADARSDIYSLGCTFYYLLTGKPPYDKPKPMDAMEAQLTEPMPILRDALPKAPDGVIAVFEKMMAKAPKDRYDTTDRLIADLERLELSKPSVIAASTEAGRMSAFLPILVVGIIVLLALVIWASL